MNLRGKEVNGALAYRVCKEHGGVPFRVKGANMCVPNQVVAYFKPRCRWSSHAVGGKSSPISCKATKYDLMTILWRSPLEFLDWTEILVTKDFSSSSRAQVAQRKVEPFSKVSIFSHCNFFWPDTERQHGIMNNPWAFEQYRFGL